MFRSIILSTTALLIASTAYGAEKKLPHIVITATKTPIDKDKVGNSITVISREEIEKSAATQVIELIKRAPSVTISTTGGAGSISNVRIRGSNPGQVRVLVDGVFMGDPSNVNTDYDFGSLLVDDIERIEILRGAQSALYGSDSMGGVINIITRKGRGAMTIRGVAEAGSYETFKQAGSISGEANGFDYLASLQHANSEGFSRVRAGRERDGYNDKTLSTALGYNVNDMLRLEASGRYSDLDTEFDPGATTDGQAETKRQTATGRTAAIIKTFEGKWQHLFSGQVARTDRENNEPSGFNRFSSFDGTVTTGEYQSNLSLRARDMLTVGLITEEQKAKSTTTNGSGVTSLSTDRDIRTNSIYGQYLLSLADTTTLTLGTRHDSHSMFGTNTTYRAAISQEFPETGTILRSSIGTGFKAPTLYQLYASFGGNRNLNPEKSKSYDIGIEQRFIDNRLKLELTGFYNDYDNLIDFSSSLYRNIRKATTRGVETGASYFITPEWSVSANYTYLLGVDETTNRILPRRPKHSFNAGMDYNVTDAWRVGGNYRYSARQLDSNFSPVFTQDYGVFDATAGYKLNDKVEIYGRLDNLLDSNYQETWRYQSTGRALYVGVKATY